MFERITSPIPLEQEQSNIIHFFGEHSRQLDLFREINAEFTENSLKQDDGPGFGQIMF